MKYYYHGQVLTKGIHYNETGNADTLSNKITFIRSENDNWTLANDVTITAIVRGVVQESEVQESE